MKREAAGSLLQGAIAQTVLNNPVPTLRVSTAKIAAAPVRLPLASNVADFFTGFQAVGRPPLLIRSVPQQLNSMSVPMSEKRPVDTLISKAQRVPFR